MYMYVCMGYVRIIYIYIYVYGPVLRLPTPHCRNMGWVPAHPSPPCSPPWPSPAPTLLQPTQTMPGTNPMLYLSHLFFLLCKITRYQILYLTHYLQTTIYCMSIYSGPTMDFYAPPCGRFTDNSRLHFSHTVHSQGVMGRTKWAQQNPGWGRWFKVYRRTEHFVRQGHYALRRSKFLMEWTNPLTTVRSLSEVKGFVVSWRLWGQRAETSPSCVLTRPSLSMVNWPRTLTPKIRCTPTKVPKSATSRGVEKAKVEAKVKERVTARKGVWQRGLDTGSSWFVPN